MEYKKYIDLGFVRTEMQDSVEFEQTGYYGYSLEKDVYPNLSIVVCSGCLDKPKLYIHSSDSFNHILDITPEIVVDLCS